MRINNTKRQFLLAGGIVAGLIVAFLFVSLFEIYWFMIAPYWLTVLIDVILGMFILVAIGMVFSEDSRVNGFLFAIALGYIAYYFISQDRIIIDALLFGSFAGALVIVSSVLRNRFDLLAVTAKALLSLSFCIIVLYLFYGFTLTDTALNGSAQVNELSAQNIFFYGVGIFITGVFYVLLLYSIVGVKASDIFIFGPRESGKTYFFLGLYSHITKRYAGRYKEVILSGDIEDEENLKLANLDANIEEKKVVSRTFNYHMGMYELIGKKFGILPVTWTIVDYAGEYYDQLNEANYRASLEHLSAELEIPLRELKKRAGTIGFLQFVNKRHADKLTDIDITRSLIISTVYSRLQRAGKVIFLIDGEKIVRTREGTGKLTREFGEYVKTLMDLEGGRMFRLFGGNKKYALAVTKTDIVARMHPEIHDYLRSRGLTKLSEINDHSSEAEVLEGRIFGVLDRILVFKNLVNIMNDLSFTFVAVSVDATAEPFATGETGAEEDVSPRQLAPWRFGEIFKFGF
ncbi:MAG: hypothetical protein GKC04_07715 [Methanomicrobiales archaeon]|nr:hypothetical protein [Methanomicrobiales archaeon]